MDIGIVSERSGIPVKSVRYYENISLVQPARLKNGYRDFTVPDLHELAFPGRVRSLGFIIEEWRALLSLYEDRELSSANVTAFARSYTARVDWKTDELEALSAILRDFVFFGIVPMIVRLRMIWHVPISRNRDDIALEQPFEVWSPLMNGNTVAMQKGCTSHKSDQWHSRLNYLRPAHGPTDNKAGNLCLPATLDVVVEVQKQTTFDNRSVLQLGAVKFALCGNRPSIKVATLRRETLGCVDKGGVVTSRDKSLCCTVPLGDDRSIPGNWARKTVNRGDRRGWQSFETRSELPEANISASSEQSRSFDCEEGAPSQFDHSKTSFCFRPNQNTNGSLNVVCRGSHLEWSAPHLRKRAR